jgi:hypothetical protein
MANLIDQHAQKIVGVLSCFDRLVLQGTLPSVVYAQAMATELDRRDIRWRSERQHSVALHEEEIPLSREAGHLLHERVPPLSEAPRCTRANCCHRMTYWPQSVNPSAL